MLFCIYVPRVGQIKRSHAAGCPSLTETCTLNLHHDQEQFTLNLNVFSFLLLLHLLYLCCMLYVYICVFILRKGYRTDATVSVLLGFLLFLIPARRPFSSSPSSSYRNTGQDHALVQLAVFDIAVLPLVYLFGGPDVGFNISDNVKGVSEVVQHCKSTSVIIHVFIMMVQTSYYGCYGCYSPFIRHIRHKKSFTYD